MSKLIKYLILIIIITLMLLAFLNFVFVWFSPKIVSNLNVNYLNKIDKCYRTLYHTNLDISLENKIIHLVIGDSYSEGMGDEFLSNDKDYGLIKKIKKTSEELVHVVFGRSGYGSISAYYELRHCFDLLNKFTTLNIKKDNIKFIDFIFYEGNDLNNNLDEINNLQNIELKISTRRLKFFLPLFDLLISVPQLIKLSNFNKLQNKVSSKKEIINNQVVIPLPQSAATELSQNELIKSLKIFGSSFLKIQNLFPDSQINLLYVPSVVTMYPFEGNIRVQSYKGKKFFNTSKELNKKRSSFIRSNIKSFCNEQKNCNYCDATNTLQDAVVRFGPTTGPKDWHHLNKLGYKTLSEVYKMCFLN